MAIIPVGSATVDFSSQTPGVFPSVSLNDGVGYVFYLEAVPVSQLIEYGYLIVCPVLTLGSLVFELACRYKWYPKGIRYSFVVPVYLTGGFPLSVVVSLLPIEKFRGRAKPELFSAQLFYEDALTQPIGFGF